MTDRRSFIKQTGLLSAAGIIGADQIAMAEKPSKVYIRSKAPQKAISDLIQC